MNQNQPEDDSPYIPIGTAQGEYSIIARVTFIVEGGKVRATLQPLPDLSPLVGMKGTLVPIASVPPTPGIAPGWLPM